MRLIGKDKLVELQKNPRNIRNICIMAHVDHGKTTLADSLVASNGIISQRLAGRLRYLDSRKDEQERGITMKSSSIALNYAVAEVDYLVNLIDSPGHVDFSSEVSTAVRLCDGAMIVIDVVEGVCAQTIVALRQAWQENIKLVLILNKIDRLILELKLTPLDAYIWLVQILEKVNLIVAELLTSEALGEETTNNEASDAMASSTDQPEYYEWSAALDAVDDSKVYFSPDQGNVLFGSAYDGWGFRVEDFARIFSPKIGVKEGVLNKTLWGDYYLNTKLKRICKGAQEKAKKPMFVQLVLENIWAMYDAVAVRKDKIQLEKMVQNLGLNIHPRNLKQTDVKAVLQSVMSAWLPLSDATLDMVCKKLPSPLELEPKRAERLMFSKAKDFAILPPESQALKDVFVSCDTSNDAPVIVFVSKMFAVDPSSLPENRPKVLTAEEIAARREQAKQRLAERQALQQAQEATGEVLETSLSASIGSPPEEEEKRDVFIAFCRVYSGTVRPDSDLYVLGPRYDPSTAQSIDLSSIPSALRDLQPGQHVTKVTIKHLYMLMGRELEELSSAPAGNIIGIGGLEDHILKTATITSTLLCPPFVDLNLLAVPILRVALEPVHTSDLNKLTQGLKFLNQADPCVQIYTQETGEHILVTAGEVHLQRCLDDLRERFAKIPITASPPIVPFRETVINPPKVDMMNELIEVQHKLNQMIVTKRMADVEEDGTVKQTTPNKRCSFKIRAVPLPAEVTHLLEGSQELIRSLMDVQKASLTPSINGSVPSGAISTSREFKENLRTAFKTAGWEDGVVERICAFGPKKCGPNVLICEFAESTFSVWSNIVLEDGHSVSEHQNDFSAYMNYFINGFQLATMAGPLCEEPMMGVAFLIRDWNLVSATAVGPGATPNDTDSLHEPYGPFSGQLISAVKDGCRKAFQAQPQRLMVAMYSCSIQVNSEALGKLYAVLGKRGGRILHGDLQEGSTVFEVTALLPVVESFDFSNEVRRQTSGLALPQMVFSGWEVLEIDPFWQPTTEEEYLHYGEKADTENRAKKYMNAVRKRKGLRVEEKTVEFAEKQRTLTKNK